jgi:hypothetical protein
MNIIHKRLLQILIVLVLQTSPVVQADRYKRPMHINKVETLGLEIWTEYEPEWIAELVKQGSKPIYVVQTPPNVYPPAAMSYVSFPTMPIKPDELQAITTSAIREAAINYQVTPEQRNQIQPTAASYNQLTGYQATFTGVAHGDAVDVKVFVGHKPDKGLIAMQAYTLAGKLPHISEHIRRAWQHVDYLD